jgi:hypothetical protein
MRYAGISALKLRFQESIMIARTRASTSVSAAGNSLFASDTKFDSGTR